MIQICKIDKDRDLGPVIPGLNPDINELINSHKISDTSSDVVYNNLSEITDIGFRVNDDFDAVLLSRALHASGLLSSKGTGSSQAAGSTAPVSSNE